MKIVGYIRVSTDRQEASPDAQRAAITAWCEARGAELVATLEDIGVSGATALAGRPGLLAAIDALPRGGALLASKRDRLGRDVVVVAMLERLAERKGARVLTADGAGEGDGPESQLMRRIVDCFAEYERALISSRTTAALTRKRANGQRTGAVPFGKRLADDRKTLLPNEAEMAVLAKIRALHARGKSLRDIASALNDKGFRTRRGTPWDFRRIRALLDPDRARDETRAYRTRRRARGVAA